MTVAVKAGFAQGMFEDGARMARLDVVFANRYLGALASYRRSEPASECWRVALEATDDRRPILLQHLLLGMNAHINLDLGVAAAETAPGPAFASLKNDFDRINQILANSIDRVQADVGSLSPALSLLDRVGGRTDEAIINFSIDRARQCAWTFASQLAARPSSAWAEAIASQDRQIASLARRIATPRPWVTVSMLWIRVRESWDVRRNIDVLSAS